MKLAKLLRKKKKLAPVKKQATDKAKTAVVTTTGPLVPVSKSPDESLGELFHDVQAKQVYPDGKTFVDLVPKVAPRVLEKKYTSARKAPDFDLQQFVGEHFVPTPPQASDYQPGDAITAREHIRALWPVLRRRNRRNRGSLVALPHAYVVPGGRFSEQFYWDTYFIMLGLAADKEWTTIHGMIRNYAYMLRRFGMIPTANRTYFLSRSQPPYFALMIKLLAQHRGRTRTYSEYLPALLAEYRFWMKGRRSVAEHPDRHATARVVQMPDGSILNRYFDNKTTPRPESRREDIETAEATHNKEKMFLDLRAGAESGWDFSSRWFSDANEIQTIHATDFVAVDLNCLLYIHEQTIAETYTLIKQPLLAKKFRRMAERRAESVRRYCWDAERQFFTDYDFRRGKVSPHLTLAGVYPLYAKIATTQQAAAVARMLEAQFLKKGGLQTTLVNNGQQWDAPNGWAPLQWMAIQGLRQYGYHALADTIRERWLTTNDAVFARHRKMVEKYDVVKGGLGGGGEYALQDGFGWTNGVYAALYDEKQGS